MAIVHQFDPTRAPFTPYGFSCVLWKPTLTGKADRHNEVEINFLKSGSLTYLLGGQRTTVTAGRLALFWGAIPHQIVAWEGRDPYFVVTLPLGWFLAAGLPEALVKAVLTGLIVGEAIATKPDEARFVQWEEDWRTEDATRQRASLLEIQARLMRMETSLPKRARTRVSDPTLSKADLLACHIARHYAEPLTAEDIAEAVDLHPNYAMSVFRKAFGTTMNDFITQHRISHAQRLLVMTHDPIIEIAFASGFHSISRFNEAFKKACECSPREYRRTQGMI